MRQLFVSALCSSLHEPPPSLDLTAHARPSVTMTSAASHQLLGPTVSDRATGNPEGVTVTNYQVHKQRIQKYSTFQRDGVEVSVHAREFSSTIQLPQEALQHCICATLQYSIFPVRALPKCFNNTLGSNNIPVFLSLAFSIQLTNNIEIR